MAVRLWEVSAYERLKDTKQHRGLGVEVMPSNQCFRLANVKFLLMQKNILFVLMVKLFLSLI